jgi:hypothetical protein
MTQKPDGGPAYPQSETLYDDGAELVRTSHGGMSLRDYFAGQALANPEICTGKAMEWQLRKWFGERTGITRVEIVAKQAYEYADAMIAAREADQ